jgi:hypothetical protein
MTNSNGEQRKPCIIKNCEHTVSARSQFPECHNCRQAFRYWYKLPAARVVQRQEALIKYQDRMEQLITYPKGQKHERVVKSFHISTTRNK